MVNNKKVVRIMLYVVVLIIATNLVSMSFPINRVNIVSDEQMCKRFNLIENADNNHYVTRMEFLRALLKSIGLTDAVVEMQSSILFEDPIVSEIYNKNKYYYILDSEKKIQSQNDIWAEVQKYESICRIAANSTCLQVYEEKKAGIDGTYEFRGTNFITVNEAVSMIQACLTDTENYFGMIDKNSMPYKNLCMKARLSGILLPIDCAWWSVYDAKLSNKDMSVLLSRLLNKKRYRYVAKNNSMDIWGTDDSYSMTYYDYLCQEVD